MAGSTFAQGKIITYKHVAVWAQGNRNAGTKGSALSTKDGSNYSLQNVIKKSAPKAIDMLCAYGKVDKKGEQGFILFAPNNPELEINWEKSGGTIPFRYFEASPSDATGASALKNWAVRNATKIQKVSDVDFDNATPESIAGLNIADSYMASELQVGDIIAFETAATAANPGKKGLIKISKIEDDEREDKAGQGSFQCLNMIIKIQK